MYDQFFKNQDQLTIAVDLDNTLAYTGKGFSPGEIGPPIPKMLNKVKNFLKSGHKVVIFTARATNPENIPIVQDWCLKHFGIILPVTNVKTPEIDVIIDDKSQNPYNDVHALDDIMDVQLNDSSNKTSEYMRGLSNGLIVAKSVLTGQEPKFLESYKRYFNESATIQRYWLHPNGTITLCEGSSWYASHAYAALEFPEVKNAGFIRNDYDGDEWDQIRDIALESGYQDFVVEKGTLWIRIKMENMSNVQQKAIQRFAIKQKLRIRYDEDIEHG